MDSKDIKEKLKNWKLPKWMEALDELSINRCLACKLEGVPHDSGVPDIEVEDTWLEVKGFILTSNEYASLVTLLGKYPKDKDTILLIYGRLLPSYEKELYSKFPYLTILSLGKGTLEFSGSPQTSFIKRVMEEGVNLGLKDFLKLDGTFRAIQGGDWPLQITLASFLGVKASELLRGSSYLQINVCFTVEGLRLELYKKAIKSLELNNRLSFLIRDIAGKLPDWLRLDISPKEAIIRTRNKPLDITKESSVREALDYYLEFKKVLLPLLEVLRV